MPWPQPAKPCSFRVRCSEPLTETQHRAGSRAPCLNRPASPRCPSSEVRVSGLLAAALSAAIQAQDADKHGEGRRFRPEEQPVFLAWLRAEAKAVEAQAEAEQARVVNKGS